MASGIPSQSTGVYNSAPTQDAPAFSPPSQSGTPNAPNQASPYFDATIAALMQADVKNDGLDADDLTRAKFGYEATSAKGNMEDLAYLNLLGDIMGTEHPQSYAEAEAAGFIEKYDADGSGTLEQSELEAAANSYLASTGQASPPAKAIPPATPGENEPAFGSESSGAEEPNLSYNFSLADLDADGNGVIDAEELSSFTAFAEKEVLGKVGPDGTITLNNEQTVPASTDSAPEEPTNAETGGLTGAQFIEMYNLDGQPGLSKQEITQIIQGNTALIEALQSADTDGTPGLSAAEIQSIASTEIGQSLVASGQTEISAEDLNALIQNLQINNAMLENGDLDGDGIIIDKEIDTLLADINSGSASQAPVGGASQKPAPSTTNGLPPAPSAETTPEPATSNSQELKQTSPEDFITTYDIVEKDSKLSQEEISLGIEINEKSVAAFAAADTDKSGDLSSEEIQASAELSKLIPANTKLSAQDIETYTSLIKEENLLLESLLDPKGSPVTLADIEKKIPANPTPTTNPAPSDTPSDLKPASKTSVSETIMSLDWSDPKTIIEAFDTNGDGKLDVVKELNETTKTYEGHIKTISSAIEQLNSLDPKDTAAYQQAVSTIAQELQKAGIIDGSVAPDVAYLTALADQLSTVNEVLTSLAQIDASGNKDGVLDQDEIKAALGGTKTT